MNNEILFFIYSIFYKLADEFDDEEIYNLYFPNGKVIIYPILILYTIYLFYFNDYSSDVFIILFVFELWYILIIIFCYFDIIFLVKIAEIKLTLEDPFILLTIFQFPMFFYKFYSILKNNLFIIIFSIFFGALSGGIQDIDNSILGTYVLNNKYKNENKKEYKIIYRIFLVLLFSLSYFFIKKSIIQLTFLFCIGYFGTSVVSLTLQIILENNIEDKKLEEKIYTLKENIRSK